MRHFKLLIYASLLFAFASSCSKSNSNVTPIPVDPAPVSKITTVGNTTDYNGYVVKTIGISRIYLALDDNLKLTVASMYGGGNKVILKPGSTNTLEIKFANVATVPDKASSVPDGVTSFIDQEIDNGKVMDTTATQAATIKIKGFDKSKTGYNQLNIVMSKYLWPAAQSGGYYTNVSYLKMTEEKGKVNADYAGMLYQLLSGPISVSYVEIAPPLSSNPYITEDQIVSVGQSSYDPRGPITYNVQMSRLGFSFETANIASTGSARNLKFSWANASDGIVSAADAYTYILKFNNMKVGDRGMIVEPSDSTSRPFFRISGYDKKAFGFNQLRLFIANDGRYDGGLQVIHSVKQTSAPTVEAMKAVYATSGMFGNYAAPTWPHF